MLARSVVIRKSIFILKILIILLHQWQNFHVSVGDDESLIIRTMIVRSKKFVFCLIFMVGFNEIFFKRNGTFC